MQKNRTLKSKIPKKQNAKKQYAKKQNAKKQNAKKQNAKKQNAKTQNAKKTEFQKAICQNNAKNFNNFFRTRFAQTLGSICAPLLCTNFLHRCGYNFSQGSNE